MGIDNYSIKKAYRYHIQDVRRFPGSFLYILGVVCFLLLQAQNARGQGPVFFRVDMNHQFLDAGDRVMVLGNHPELGNWKTGGLVLKERGKKGIYVGQARFKNHVPGDSLLYKYVIERHDGTLDWESCGNRVLVISRKRQKLALSIFGNRSGQRTRRTIYPVTFRFDLSQFTVNGIKPDTFALMGGQNPLTWQPDNTDEQFHLKQNNDSVWYTRVNFPYGTPRDVPFKLVWKRDGKWQWEYLPGHSNHLLWLDENEKSMDVSMQYNKKKGIIVPAGSSPVLVDTYYRVIQKMGKSGWESEYPYYLAMRLLQDRKPAKAQKVYRKYRRHHAGGSEIDDFVYEMGKYLAENGPLDQALNYLDRKASKEPYSYRRAQIQYVKGELLAAAGKPYAARDEFKKVIEQYGNSEDVSGTGNSNPVTYSKWGIAYSYASHSDSLGNAEAYLEDFVQSADNPREKHRRMNVLYRYYKSSGNLGQRKQLLRRLTKTGDSRQKRMASYQLLEAGLKTQKSAVTRSSARKWGRAVDSLVSAENDRRQKARIAYLKIRHSRKFETEEALISRLQRFIATYPESRYVPHLQKRLERLMRRQDMEMKAYSAVIDSAASAHQSTPSSNEQ